MRKDDLLDMLRAENTEESRELRTKLIFLKEMFFKNELNETEQDEYLNIHDKDALKAFAFSSKLQKQYEEYCKEEPLFGEDNLPFGKVLMNKFFGGYHSDRGPRRGADIEKVIIVTPEEASKGTTRFIRADGRRIEIIIPAGANNKTRILMKHMGEKSPNGGESGDLRVCVYVKTSGPNNSSEDVNDQEMLDDVQEKKIVVDPKKKYLCKYHHNTGCTSDKPGDGFSEKRCPGCGLFFIPLRDSLDSANYVKSSDPSYRDDENDIERIQDSYDPPEAIRNDDGGIEYW